MGEENIKILFKKWVKYMKSFNPDEVDYTKKKNKGRELADKICSLGYVMDLDTENKTVNLHRTLGKMGKYEKKPIVSV